MGKQEIQVPTQGQLVDRDIGLMCLPVIVMAVFYYGPRALGLILAAMLTAAISDRITALLTGKKPLKGDRSSLVTALLIVLLMPVTVRFRVVVVAVLVGILIGKEAFGGSATAPFHPTAVGFCVAAAAWPGEVFRYPDPQQWMGPGLLNWEQFVRIWSYAGVSPVETAAYTLQHAGIPQISVWKLWLGDASGPMGTGAAVVILACAVFLLVRKKLSFSATFSFLLVSVLIAFFLPCAPEDAWSTNLLLNWQVRLQVMQYEMLSGGMLFMAVFLLNNPYILPKNLRSKIVYGVLMGVGAMMFRYFGTFEMGICFAFLLVNAVSGFFDRVFAKRLPQPKGEAEA